MSISMLTTRDGAACGVVPHPFWRIRVVRSQRIIQVGVLTADDPVELLERLLAAKMHKSRRHFGAGRLVGLALEAMVPAGWFVDTQDPIMLADSEPEPT
jgi:hypothetical protein